MSQERQCQIWKATDEKWYLEIGDFEYAYDSEHCTRYGPFDSEVKRRLRLTNSPILEASMLMPAAKYHRPRMLSVSVVGRTSVGKQGVTMNPPTLKPVIVYGKDDSPELRTCEALSASRLFSTL